MKFAANVLGLCAAYGASILVMIFGWGLHAESWGWILGGSFCAVLLGGILACLNDE